MNRFEGWYFKHHSPGNTLALIPGIADDNAFIQAITDSTSFFIPFKKPEFKVTGQEITVGNNHFSKDGITVDINHKDISIKGSIRYKNITPIKGDIMGFFKYFPMECRHGIISMHHDLDGKINLNGKELNFSHGIGYIEKDSGSSFPKSYMWIQCNCFKEKASIMASVADIPFMVTHFRGIICVIWYRGKEYRLATYNGAKVKKFSNRLLCLSKGKYLLEITVHKDGGHKLAAPINGAMQKLIKESPAAKARFRFFISNRLIFDLKSNQAGFEFVG